MGIREYPLVSPETGEAFTESEGIRDTLKSLKNVAVLTSCKSKRNKIKQIALIMKNQNEAEENALMMKNQNEALSIRLCL